MAQLVGPLQGEGCRALQWTGWLLGIPSWYLGREIIIVLTVKDQQQDMERNLEDVYRRCRRAPAACQPCMPAVSPRVHMKV